MIEFNNFDFQNFCFKYSKLNAVNILKVMIKDIFHNKIVVTSSFGAESVVILHLVSKVDLNTPIIFLNTGKLFPETLEYVNTLRRKLKLNKIKILNPDFEELQIQDEKNDLYKINPDLCCQIRKVIPLQKALKNFDAWINGRKRFHDFERKNIKQIEKVNGLIKINPLYDWSFKDIQNYININKLPEHPLVKKGYKSIGCIPCTSKVTDDEPHRSGRWINNKKTECGIHTFNPLI